VGRVGVAVVALLLAACSADPKPSADPTPAPVTEAPTEEPTREPTTEPTATPSETPTAATPTSATPKPVLHHDYVFPVAGCRVTYSRAHHDYPATDIFAPRGCAFVAPVSGRVDEVQRVDRWTAATNRGEDRGGLAVSVVGDDGVRYYGSHLSVIAPGVKPGLRVKAGARLGSVGNTGSARGIATHLHFGVSWPSRPGVWWVRRGWVYPWPYLDSWRSGGDRSPAVAVRTARAAAGSDAPRCRAYCG
jgi:murein DD-endopeptidase MepM/ murein hydrolase activator NlpD